MWGGPSHIDLFDMKPDAPSELRGPFNPVRTRTPGIRISELMPKHPESRENFGARPTDYPHVGSILS